MAKKITLSELLENPNKFRIDAFTWTVKNFAKVREEAEHGVYGAGKRGPTFTDPLTEGLRAKFETSGRVTFYAHVTVNDTDKTRIQQEMGNWPDMSIEEAREIKGIIQALADDGVNVKDAGRELRQYGRRWRP